MFLFAKTIAHFKYETSVYDHITHLQSAWSISLKYTISMKQYYLKTVVVVAGGILLTD